MLILIKKAFLFFLALLFSGYATAEENTKKNSSKSPWDYTTLYKNDQGNYFKLSGRLQLDTAYFNANQGKFDDVLWRRFRFGFKAKYGRITTALEGDFDLNKDLTDSYKRLTDANIAWQVKKDLKLTILKHSTGFTLDGRTSSKKLLTPQRNNLTNNLWFTNEYFTGVSLKGKLSDTTTFNSGLFSSDDSNEIGFTDASYFALFAIESEFKTTALWQKAKISVDYIYNDVDIDGGTSKFTHILSVSSKFSQERWHLWSDFSMGQGDLGQSDLWGAVIMPFYQQSPKIQWVMRYTYIDSDQINGIKFGKYENKVISDKSTVRGDNYHELYAGINYFFNQHKFKIHFGTQYTKMTDQANDEGKYNGWGATLAIRSYW